MPGANAAVGRRGHRAADARGAAPAARTGPRHPRGPRLAVGSRPSARRSATSAGAPSGWSATATSPSGSRRSSLAMGADVLHTSTRDDGHPGWRTLPDLLAASDIVSLHLPLTAATPPGCSTTARWPDETRRRAVNTSRGPIVDEDALVEALRAGQPGRRRTRRLRRRTGARRQSAARPRQRGADAARHLVHRRHHAPLSGGRGRQLRAASGRPGPRERGEPGAAGSRRSQPTGWYSATTM